MVKIVICDALTLLRKMPSESINCCVTSPPYFGLRDYGHAGQIGLEETPEAYVQKLVDVFQEVKRVLKKDGTCWVNLGDSYAGSWGNAGGQNRGNGTQRDITNGSAIKDQAERNGNFVPPAANGFSESGIKKKDLIGVPWRVAFALQADGWYLRQDIIWAKPNPMPESVRDRCTKAHEYIFLLAKSEKYFYDHDAVKETAVGDASGNKGRKQRPDAEVLRKGAQAGSVPWDGGALRNRRSVWTITTKPYKEAHFATFPPDLIEPCILAGCPAGGVVLDPFAGSGTTGEVAQKHGRKAVLLELNPKYAELAKKRTGGTIINA